MKSVKPKNTRKKETEISLIAFVVVLALLVISSLLGALYNNEGVFLVTIALIVGLIMGKFIEKSKGK